MSSTKKNNSVRYNMFPIERFELWQMYKKHVASFWVAEEIDFNHDKEHWKRLKPEEQQFIKMILAFFAVSDGVVVENLVSNFIDDVEVHEAKIFYTFQAAMENIHAETYSLMIETYIQSTEEKIKLFEAVENFACIREKTAWAEKWMDKSIPFAQRLIAFSVIEGVFFSAAFCSIFWLRKRGLMPGLTFSNELIARDEGLHTDFAVLLYNTTYKYVVSKDKITEIVREAVEIESLFVKEALSHALLGMNADTMIRYVRFCADRLLDEYDCPKLYNQSNPFNFMEMISMQGKTNFFEKRVGDYQKTGVMAAMGDHSSSSSKNFEFTVSADF